MKLKLRNIAACMLTLAMLFAGWTIRETAAAQKAAVPKAQNKLALLEEQVKQLLLLMETDKNGKITKQAWMNSMEAEFDRLDKSKSGMLDAKELAQSTLWVSSFSKAGK